MSTMAMAMTMMMMMVFQQEQGIPLPTLPPLSTPFGPCSASVVAGVACVAGGGGGGVWLIMRIA